MLPTDKPEDPIRLDLRAHLRRQLLAEEFTDHGPDTQGIEARVLAQLVSRWPAQLVATFSDQDLVDAGVDADRLRGAVLHALGRKRALGTEITIAVHDHYGRASAILWRGRTLGKGRRS